MNSHILTCGCEITIDKNGYFDQMYRCPLHKAAPDLLEVAKELVDFDNNALMDDHVPSELIGKAKQIIGELK